MKVFGIGLSKTGTSSLAYALELLDYNVKDCLGVTRYTKGDLSSIDEDALLHHNALTDTPIPSFYKELDKQYPASKFILTIRNMDNWLKSCKKQFNQKSADKQSEAHTKLFLDLYDTTVFDEDKFRQSYLDFTAEVKNYFKDRPNDLLVLNVTGGEGWEKLCPFLDKPVPEMPFPKTNVTSIRWLNIHELAQSVRSAALPMHKLAQSTPASETKFFDKIKDSLASTLGQNPTKKIKNTAAKAQKSIKKKLQQLNPGIPIISKATHDTPLELRRSWNHFWLISPLEGKSDLTQINTDHSFQLALIEDGLPFLGITYFPEQDTLYYAALDKGAYQAQGRNKPIKINSYPTTSTQDTAEQFTQSPQEIVIMLFQSIANNNGSHLSIENSKEWQTAAGHALLKTIGVNLIDETSQAELKYNKVDWNNASITIDPSQG